MSVIPIEVAMNHLRAVGEDKDSVQLLLNAAEGRAMQYLWLKFYADDESLQAAIAAGDADDKDIVITDDIKAGVLLILGDFYMNREDRIDYVSTVVLPTVAERVLHPHRRGLGV